MKSTSQNPSDSGSIEPRNTARRNAAADRRSRRAAARVGEWTTPSANLRACEIRGKKGAEKNVERGYQVRYVMKRRTSWSVNEEYYKIENVLN